MSIEEHANRIIAKCEQLLAGSRERTPGEWTTNDLYVVTKRNGWTIAGTESFECVGHEDAPILPREEQSGNAMFIASCAGPAEAGWKATIASIKENLRKAVYIAPCPKHPEGGPDNDAARTIDAIRVAWQEELL